MGVTRKYIHGCIYVLLEKCFQICDLREASRCARVGSLAEMERTDGGCVCGTGDFQYAYLRENSGERVIFSGKKRKRGREERERKGVKAVQMGRWGVANFIECEFARPTLFPVINLVARVARWIRRKTYASMSSCHRTRVHIYCTSHFTRYHRQHSFVLTVMNYSGLTKILASLVSKE